MDADEYIAKRLDDQIGWYDHKSLSNHSWYKWLRMTQFVAAALVTFFAAFLAPGVPTTKPIIGLIGVAIAVITSTLDLFRFQEHWIEYRTTCESLKKEKLLFQTGCEPYRGDPASNLCILVQRVETLISKENSNWAQDLRQPKSGEE